MKRSLFLAVGGVAFVIGVGLLAFGAYNAFFDDSAPPVSDARIVTASDLATTSPAPSTSPPTPTPLPPLGDQPYEMVIDKIGVDAPVQTFGLDAEEVPEIPTGDNAANVVAWYDFTARPGVGSNAVFAGHVTWFGEAVFFRLPDLALNDSIKLKGADGTLLTYRISDIFRVDAADPASRNVMFSTPTDILTIITCDGVFTPDPNNHVTGGDYDHRLVIRADLVSVAPSGAG